MNCNKLETLWMPYLDGKLSDAERRAMDSHIVLCAECALRREELGLTFQALDEWEAPPPSPWFDARLRARIAAENNVGALNWIGRRLSLLAPRFPLSLATLALMAALLIWTNGSQLPPEQLAKAYQVEEVLHVMDEVELLNDFEVISELKTPAPVER